MPTEGDRRIPRYLRARTGAGPPFVQLGGGNILKGLLLADPQAKVLGCSTKKKHTAFVGTWRRFVLANVSPALQIALSEKAAAMMARSVEISVVHASAHTLADEATLALHAQRPCWPACARKVHGKLFFRVELRGDALTAAASYPCTLLLDIIRLVCALPSSAPVVEMHTRAVRSAHQNSCCFAAAALTIAACASTAAAQELSAMRSKARHNLSSDLALGAAETGGYGFGYSFSADRMRTFLGTPEVTALLDGGANPVDESGWAWQVGGTLIDPAAAAAAPPAPAEVNIFGVSRPYRPTYGPIYGGRAGQLNGENSVVNPHIDRNSKLFGTAEEELEGRLALCRLVREGVRCCAACDRRCAVREMHYCAKCCALLCGDASCLPAAGDASCKARHCPLASPSVPAPAGSQPIIAPAGGVQQPHLPP